MEEGGGVVSYPEVCPVCGCQTISPLPWPKGGVPIHDVIECQQREVKRERARSAKLEFRMARMVHVGDKMAAWLVNERNLGSAPHLADEWHSELGRKG